MHIYAKVDRQGTDRRRMDENVNSCDNTQLELGDTFPNSELVVLEECAMLKYIFIIISISKCVIR